MHTRTSRWSWAAALCLLASLTNAGGAADLVLVKDRTPAATIVLDAKPTRVAQLAAFELQHHVERITRAKLAIVTGEAKAKGVRILIGESKATRALGLKNADFKAQEYLVRLLPDAVVLIGRDKPDRGKVVYDPSKPARYESWPDYYDPQGSLQATYDFLEKFCGVRWLNPTETGTSFQPRASLTVRGAEIRRVPTFRNRNALGGNLAAAYDQVNCFWPPNTPQFKRYEAAAHPELHKRFPNSYQYMLAKRDWNGLFLRRMRAGGEKCFSNHSLYGYYDRFWAPCKNAVHAKHFEKRRPELFAKGYAKESLPPQLCYTSKALVRQVAQDARDYFDQDGYRYEVCAIRPGPIWGKNYFSVEPMDNAAFCLCEECKKWYPPKEGARRNPFFGHGRNSDYKFNFVNRVAKEVRKTHPDKYIVTLAYGATLVHPKRVQLEPNVAVFFCFDCNRMVYATAAYEFEIQCLRDWVAKEPNRPMYLWLYYTFPNEVAANGQWFCFPGFFAHKIGEQMKLFHKLGLRGMFHCGYGQEVEAYVTYKLMDDVTRDVDTLLEEYFGGVYGPAADPLKKFYLLVEETYCNPKNYPPRYINHQSKIIAWDHLGTASRMATLTKYVLAARAAVAAKGTEAHKRNLDLFEKAVWSYMLAGRAHHVAHQRAPIPALVAARVPDAGGEPNKVDWSQAAALRDPRLPDHWYDRGLDKPSARKFSGRIAHDGTYLYLQLTDPCKTAKLTTSSGVFCYDDWEIFFAAQRAQPYRQYAVGPTGLFVALSHGEVNWRMNVPLGDHGVRTRCDTSAPDKWVARLAFPLSRFVPGGVKPGGKVYMNVTRVSGPPIAGKGPYGIDSWVSFCSVHDVDRLAEVRLAK